MKTIRKLLIGLGLLAFTLCSSQAAVLQTTTRAVNLLTNGTTAVIAGAGQSNIVASSAVVINLTQGRGLALSARLSSTNAATTQTGISIGLSVDGTNYNTVNQYWFIIPALNGTTGVTGDTNLPAWITDNHRTAKILSITNGHSASLFVTNVIAGIGN